MICPSCAGQTTRVTNSREDASTNHLRWRRYKCRECGLKFSTYEILSTEYEKVQATRINTTQIDSTIATLRSIKAQFGTRNGK
jgi:transcriptional regulator NrdR family protein